MVDEPGRWRRHDPDVRTIRPKPSFTAEEWADIVAAADRAGLRPSGYVAEAAIAAARITAPPTQSHARDALLALMQASTQLRRFGGNVNQAAAIANSTGQLPVWMPDAVSLAMRAVRRVDDAADRVGRLIR